MTMRTLPLIAFCLIAAATAVEFSNAPDAAAAPWVAEHEVFSVSIPVRNPHDRAIKVERLDSTCECSRLEIVDRFILPGASSVLHLASANRNRSGEQQVAVSIYVTDPELEAIEVVARWNVRAAVQVDAIGPGMDPTKRPEDRAWQDIYRFVAKERPDELARLRKRIRLSCPAGTAPVGGLKLSGVDYSGALWKFTPSDLADGSILITATARNPEDEMKEGTYDEKVILRTNHPNKPEITVRFMVLLDRKAGAKPFDPQALGR